MATSFSDVWVNVGFLKPTGILRKLENLGPVKDLIDG
jgi:hypothetical protein